MIIDGKAFEDGKYTSCSHWGLFPVPGSILRREYVAKNGKRPVHEPEVRDAIRAKSHLHPAISPSGSCES